jgi:hypothetical protein
MARLRPEPLRLGDTTSIVSSSTDLEETHLDCLLLPHTPLLSPRAPSASSFAFAPPSPSASAKRTRAAASGAASSAASSAESPPSASPPPPLAPSPAACSTRSGTSSSAHGAPQAALAWHVCMYVLLSHRIACMYVCAALASHAVVTPSCTPAAKCQCVFKDT